MRTVKAAFAAWKQVTFGEHSRKKILERRRERLEKSVFLSSVVGVRRRCGGHDGRRRATGEARGEKICCSR